MSWIKHADAAEIARCLDYLDLARALGRYHSTYPEPQTNVTVLTQPEPSPDTFANLTAWLAGEAIAVKMMAAFPGNRDLAFPLANLQGLVVLFDGQTGRPLMTADGTMLTYYKTVADSALGTEILARRDARTLLVVGAGGLAPHVVKAQRSVRPSIEKVVVWNHNPGKALDLASLLDDGTFGITVSMDLADALPQADIVSAVTSSEEPLIRGALLKPGCHVDLVGSYQPQMREADSEVMRRAGRLYMDTRRTYQRSGDVIHPVSEGVIDPDRGIIDLFELCSGRRTGRESDEEITVYKNIGGGHLDLFVAMELYDKLFPNGDQQTKA